MSASPKAGVSREPCSGSSTTEHENDSPLGRGKGRQALGWDRGIGNEPTPLRATPPRRGFSGVGLRQPVFRYIMRATPPEVSEKSAVAGCAEPQQSARKQHLCLTRSWAWGQMSCIACNRSTMTARSVPNGFSREENDSQRTGLR